MFRVAAIAACLATLGLIALGSAPALAASKTSSVSSGPAQAIVGTKQWSFAFKDQRRKPVLKERPGTGPGPVGRLGFNLNGEWKHATRVKKSWVRGKVRHLRVATTSNRDLKVTVEPASHGSIRLTASIMGSVKGVEAIGMSFQAPSAERYLGFGERSHSIEFRGEKIENWTGEGPYQSIEYPVVENFVPKWGLRDRDDATYYPMPWLLSTFGYGVLVENSDPSYFHLASEQYDAWRVELVRRISGLAGQPEGTPSPRSISLRFFAGPTPADVVRRLTGATGRQPSPAPFFFGPWVQPKGDAMTTVDKLRSNDIPTSLLQTYLHYLPCQAQAGKEQAQRDFTSEVHANGMAVTTYFNPMICTNRPAFVWYDRFGYLNRDDAGNPFEYDYLNYHVAQFDFANRDSRNAYGRLLQEAIDHGYDGWMEDFGEYTPPASVSASGNHGMVEHNRYPERYHCAAHDQTKNHVRPLARFVRSGWTGSAACSPVVWGGDPSTEWLEDGLRSAVRNALSMGLSGVGVWGSDIGGFFSLTSDPLSPELLTRWVQFGAFSGVMRNQANGLQIDDRYRPQVLDPDQIDNWKLYSKLRTQLYPYISGAASQYRETGMPMMRAMLLEFPRDRTALLDNQYMFGDSLLVAPIFGPGQPTRRVYLPKGKWIDFWRTFSYDEETGNFDTGPASILSGGRQEVPAPLDQIPLMIRAGAMITMLDSDVDTLSPFGQEDDSIVHLGDRKTRTLFAFPRGKSTGRFERRGRITSVEKSGILRIKVSDSQARPWTVKASTNTLKNPFEVRCVTLNGGVLAPDTPSLWQFESGQVTVNVPKNLKRFTLGFSRRRCG